MFDRLLAHPGVEEEMRLAGPFGVMAFHGGNLERRTDLIATHAAELAGASLYVVRQPPDLVWHIPSTAVRPEHSRALAEFLARVDTVIAVHGYGRRGRYLDLLLGGRNRALARSLGTALRERLALYSVVDDLAAIPAELRGQHPDNPVNLPRHGGVQLELPPRVRGLGPRWRHWPESELVPPARAVAEAIAHVADRTHG